MEKWIDRGSDSTIVASGVATFGPSGTRASIPEFGNRRFLAFFGSPIEYCVPGIQDINIGIGGLVDWFKCFHPTRWIGTTNGTYRTGSGRSYQLMRTPYEDLGNVVRSGYYTTVGTQTHATFFVDWCLYSKLSSNNEKLKFIYKKSLFNKDGDNGFLTIGGNQGDVVTVEPRTLTKFTVDDRNADIKWDEVDIKNSDGFGNAKNRLRKEL